MFIVVFDNGDCLCIPMVEDKDCQGALSCGSMDGKDKVALFLDRKQARKAIEISTKFALLCKSQGKPVNVDFIGYAKKCVKIIPCVEYGKAK